MDMVSACVTDVNTLEVLVEVHTILRQLLLLVVVLTLYVLVVFIHVTPETVVDVVDVLLM
jgi:hypothetical protein